ncbi:hypothetical protein HN51_010746 [Arachis hypogaea]|nr:uncharacterized protein DS421_3g68960 [Arachis hypogaea]
MEKGKRATEKRKEGVPSPPLLLIETGAVLVETIVIAKQGRERGANGREKGSSVGARCREAAAFHHTTRQSQPSVLPLSLRLPSLYVEEVTREGSVMLLLLIFHCLPEPLGT